MGSSWKRNPGFMVSEYYYMTKNLNSHINKKKKIHLLIEWQEAWSRTKRLTKSFSHKNI
jgi:hypothetical protein